MIIERELVKRQNPIISLIDELLSDESSTTTPRPTPTPRPRPGDEDEDEDDDDEDEESSSTTRRRTSSDSESSSTRSSSSSQPTSAPTSLPQPPSSRERSTLVNTTSANDPNASNGLANNNSNDSNNKGLSPLIIGIIVAASVIFGLILLALIARKFFQMRRRRRRNTWGAGSIAPFAPPPAEDEKAAYPPASRAYGSTEGGYGQDTYAASLGAYRGPAPPPKPEVNAYNTNTYGSSYSSQYPAGPTYNAPQIYSPAAPSSAGYAAPYGYNNNNTAGYGGISAATGAFNKSAYNPADLVGATPIGAIPTTPKIQISVVRRTYQPTLPDELSIATGESVQILDTYDDGWCKVQRLGTNEVGVVPYECLEASQGGASGLAVGDDTRSKRASSLFSGKN